ncbi:hypothetical protein L3I75_004469 [Vibrio vulnificus]|nr:hypothetical protein [Vibrio vulnificus]EIU7865261.1 hypothetical protein [Vibrio vulnificus]EJE8581429.1 hypothetical protein [Vibrio vulnificus]
MRKMVIESNINNVLEHVKNDFCFKKFVSELDGFPFKSHKELCTAINEKKVEVNHCSLQMNGVVFSAVSLKNEHLIIKTLLYLTIGMAFLIPVVASFVLNEPIYSIAVIPIVSIFILVVRRVHNRAIIKSMLESELAVCFLYQLCEIALLDKEKKEVYQFVPPLT